MPWYKTIGPDYVADAFRYAHEEDQDNPRPDKVQQRPTPFDSKLKPKPAYSAIAHSLAGAPKRRLAWHLPPQRHI